MLHVWYQDVDDDVSVYNNVIRQSFSIDIKTILNSDELISKINDLSDDDFENSTVGKKDGDYIDTDIRLSKKYKDAISFYLTNLNVILDTEMIIDDKFDVIKYEKCGKFDMHVDTQIDDYNYTVMIYPPQKVKGGELCVLNGYQSKLSDNRILEKIEMSEELWTIVLLPVGVMHSSNEVLEGTKIIIKGRAKLLHTKCIKQIIPYVRPNIINHKDVLSFIHHKYVIEACCRYPVGYTDIYGGDR